MEATVRKEEIMADSEYGVEGDAEGDRSGGERSEPERRSPSRARLDGFVTVESEVPDPEVPAKASRRRFSATYKKRILEEAAVCKGTPGAIGSLLRREGLYSSHLTAWKKQREKGELDGLAPKKRGRKKKPVNPLARKVRELESETRRLRRQLDKAETIIAFQKKLSEMLGISLDQKGNHETC
jgi:transposase-like protein